MGQREVNMPIVTGAVRDTRFPNSLWCPKDEGWSEIVTAWQTPTKRQRAKLWCGHIVDIPSRVEFYKQVRAGGELRHREE